MATGVTAQTGSWSKTDGTSPWAALTGSGPGGVPGAGDNVIASSTHTLTCDGTQSIGTNGPNAPGAAPTVSASAGATPTNLPTGNYYVRLVAVNANGESTCSPESAVLALTNGVSTPRIVLPALPTGGTSWSIYLTNTGTAAAGITHRRYATGQSAGNYEPVSASWEDGTVAFASAKLISPASAIWGTGIFNLAAGASLTVAGDVQTTHASGTTLGAGSTVTMSVPSGQTFYWSPGGFTNGAMSPLIGSGTSGSRVTFQRSGSGTAAIVPLPLISGNGRGVVQATYTDFIDIGSASVNANTCAFFTSTVYTLTYCTMTRCGEWVTSNPQSTQSVTITNNKWTDSVGTRCLLMDLGASYSSGTRLIARNAMDKVFQFTSTPGSFTIDDNLFGGGVTMSGVTAAPTSFKRNIWCKTASAVANLYFGCSDNILYFKTSNMANSHGIDPAIRNADATISGWVFDGVTPDNTGDLILPNTSTPASDYTLTITGNLYLPGLTGDNIGTPCTLYGNSKLSVVFNHNTYVMGIQGFSYGEAGGYAGRANMVTSFRSNCAWNPTKLTNAGWLVWDALAGPFDAVAGQITTCDYNGKYNYATTTSFANANGVVLAKGYQTSTVANGHYVFVEADTDVGAHDIDANPRFFDNTRSMQTFDRGCLGYPVATAWASGQSYAVGDIRSSTVSGAFFGLAINYRCVSAHTSTSSGATGPPGSGTTASPVAWSTYWEAASLEYIRNSLVAGTTYDGTTLGGSAGVSINEIERLWVRRGWAPTNPLYNGTAHDATTPGAVSWFARPFERHVQALARPYEVPE